METGDRGAELRPLAEDVADEVFSAVDRNRERLRLWLGWVDGVRTVDDTLKWIRTDDEVTYTVWDRGRLAGCVGYTVDQINDQARFGFWLDESAEGRGLITGAVRALLRECFEEKSLHRAEICCAAGNRRSRAVPERLGFRQEGIRRQAEKLPHGYIDLVVYGLLASEWHQIGQS